MEFSATYNATYSAKASIRDETSIKPCLENIDEIQFKPNELIPPENTLFGPVNNRYKKKTNDELKDSAEWTQPKGWDFQKYCKEAVNDLRNEDSRVDSMNFQMVDLTGIISRGKPHCKSNDLESLLDWFDEQSYLINATVGSSFTIFHENLNDILEFEDIKEDMINK